MILMQKTRFYIAEKAEKHEYLILLLLVFGLLYASISFVNHYLFRTYALDLGLYTNAIFAYSNFQMADSSMIKEHYESLLGSHFDIYLILFSPLRYIFGTYTLLLVQIAFVLLGGIGVYSFFNKNDKQKIAIAATAYFFLFFGIFSAVSYDYHSVVVVSGLIPWFFYYFSKKRYAIASVLVVAILISQENVSLFLTFILLGLMFEYRKERNALKYLILYTFFSITYFVVVTQFIIPSFSPDEHYSGFLHAVLGETPKEALKNLLSRPIPYIKTLFVNHNNSLSGDYVKAEAHIILLLSGVLFLLAKPQYLLMLIPIYMQKFYHDNHAVWSVGGQYSVEFAPILAIGVFSVVQRIRSRAAVRIFVPVVLLLSLVATIRIMDNTIGFTRKSEIRFYQKKHYSRGYDVREVHEQLRAIPKNARVSAQSPFVPHLALRNNIYQFPLIADAEYIILSTHEKPYPLMEEEYVKEVNKLEQATEWNTVYSNEHLIIKRKQKSGLEHE